ncbi:MAG TPA: hypothetical protein VEA99_10365 [Gemmatimonadaceae bacterium]|nr:hypothetical protein [Gemmatimonadaceae bacterium]
MDSPTLAAVVRLLTEAMREHRATADRCARAGKRTEAWACRERAAAVEAALHRVAGLGDPSLEVGR